MKDCEPIGTDHLGTHWKEMVAEVVSETDPQQRREKVAAAEAAIFQRLQRLAMNSGDRTPRCGNSVLPRIDCLRLKLMS